MEIVRPVPVSSVGLVPRTDIRARLAKRIEEAPLDRQHFFKNKMDEVRGRGRCEWCGSEGRLWSMYLRNALHNPRAPDGRILPLSMCYQCCELELATPQLPLPDAESRIHPVDISFRRDRSQDLGHDARPMSDLEKMLYAACGTAPRGGDVKREVGFIVMDDAAAKGKTIIRADE